MQHIDDDALKGTALVRPDGVIAWHTTEPPTPLYDVLNRVLALTPAT